MAVLMARPDAASKPLGLCVLGLVATLGSSAAAVVKSVKNNPASAPSLLANNIPTASTFYLSYFLLQGLGIVANALLAVVGLIVFKVLGRLLDNTPRKMYNRWISLAGLGWGTLFPIYTNLFVSLHVSTHDRTRC